MSSVIIAIDPSGDLFRIGDLVFNKLVAGNFETSTVTCACAWAVTLAKRRASAELTNAVFFMRGSLWLLTRTRR